MAKKPKILAFAGSLRENSYNKRVVKVALEGAKAAGAEVTFIDLKDYPMPIYNPDEQEKHGFDENAAAFQKLLSEHDGLLIASPEYNGTIPGGLKNAIDWASRKNDDYEMLEVFRGKIAAILTASPSVFGGVRCLAHLRGMFTVMLVNVLPSEIAVAKVGEMFEGDSEKMSDKKMKETLENVGKSLADILKKTHGEIEVVEEAS